MCELVEAYNQSTTAPFPKRVSFGRDHVVLIAPRMHPKTAPPTTVATGSCSHRQQQTERVMIAAPLLTPPPQTHEKLRILIKRSCVVVRAITASLHLVRSVACGTSVPHPSGEALPQ